MTTLGRLLRTGYAVTGLVLLASVTTHALANPDEPAAVLVYPYVAVDPATGSDTLIQLTNTSDALVELRCFYEDFTPQCSSEQPGESCFPGGVTCTGLCVPHRTVLPLRLRATAQQPLAWHASTGLQTLPLDGVEHLGPLAESNQFSSVPGVGTGPFVGTLRCVAMTSDPYRPLPDNVLVGQATIERSSGTPVSYTDAAQYRAVGIKALPGGANRDEFLNLGGPAAEYEACPAVGLLEHFFDGAPLQTGEVTADVSTTLVLTNCTVLPSGTNNGVLFFVYNEFDQRFSTSRAVVGQLVAPLSMIDTITPQRSIFWYQVSGTLTGRTLVGGGMSGLHLVAIESHRNRSMPDRVQSDAINAHGLGERQQGDVVTFRPPRCAGDCNFDGNVTIDEVIQGVKVDLATLPMEACVPIDGNLDSKATIDEVESAIAAAVGRCPDPVPPPTPVETPGPTPTAVPPPDSVGPEITHLGVATADDRPLQPDSTDTMGRPVFVRPFGQGMTLIVEARRGQSHNMVGTSTYSQTGELPDLQMLVSRPLGDGDATVCESNGRSGGIPAVASLDFTPDPATVAAINDLGCRAFDRGVPPADACTRKISSGMALPAFGTVNNSSEIQFCVPVAKAWAFPVGETVVAARVRDNAGNVGAVQEIVVRVLE